MPTSKSWIYHVRTGIVYVCWASPFIKYIYFVHIYIQLEVPSVLLFTASRGRVYTGAFHTNYIILLSICTSRIPCSTYKLKLHTSQQGTTSNMQRITEASRERIQASHDVASCHDPEDVNHGRIHYQPLLLLFINQHAHTPFHLWVHLPLDWHLGVQAKI